jgi:DNA-binding transcriptional regulator YbjK
VAARDGVRGVTHRKVAAEAGVTLSTTSYHLTNIDLIMLESFHLFADMTAERYNDALQHAMTLDELARALITLVRAFRENGTDISLMYELWTQATRDERYREIVASWSRATMAAVARVVGDETAHRTEVVLDGVLQHWMVHSEAVFPEDKVYALLMTIFTTAEEVVVGGGDS